MVAWVNICPLSSGLNPGLAGEGRSSSPSTPSSDLPIVFVFQLGYNHYEIFHIGREFEKWPGS
jgi:hypothetical protein